MPNQEQTNHFSKPRHKSMDRISPALGSKDRKVTADWLAAFRDIAVLCPSHPLHLQQLSAEILHCNLIRSEAKAPTAVCTHCQTGRRALTCSLRRVPSPASSPAVSVILLKKESISTAHPLVLPDELLEETLDEPTLKLSMCLKREASSKVAGSFPVIVT